MVLLPSDVCRESRQYRRHSDSGVSVRFDEPRHAHASVDPRVDALCLAVDWPCLPCQDEGLDIEEDLDPVTVASVGSDLDGHPIAHVGCVALNDIHVA